MKKSALITGGLGFIGSHLVDLLKKKGWKITVVDNCSHNSIDPNRLKGVKVYSMSIEQYNPRTKFDVIFHLASIVGPAGVLKHGGNIGYRMINDTKKIIDWCYKMNARLIDVSTSEVYGHDGRLDEEAPKVCEGPTTIRREYGVGKLVCEIMIQNSHKIKPFEWSIVRPFNVAGSRQQGDAGFVTPRFCQQALNGDSITVFGTGEQKRAFTHVYDIVEGLYVLATVGKQNEVWNLGNPNNETTILDYAKLVKKITKSKSKIIFTSGKEIYGEHYAEVPNKLPISTKARKLLNWKPKRFLKDIINDCVSDCKKNN